jgi:hypothetical protein
MSVELGCRRDVNAPEFIIAGVPKVTAGDGGAGGSEVIKIPLPISIPGPIKGINDLLAHAVHDWCV